jgi:hypothetical protein
MSSPGSRMDSSAPDDTAREDALSTGEPAPAAPVLPEEADPDTAVARSEVTPSAPRPADRPPDLHAYTLTADSRSRLGLFLVAVAFLTTLLLVVLIAQTKAWDPYLCQTNDDCRGLTRCIDSRCVLPEVWQLQSGGAAPPVGTQPESPPGE